MQEAQTFKSLFWIWGSYFHDKKQSLKSFQTWHNIKWSDFGFLFRRTYFRSGAFHRIQNEWNVQWKHSLKKLRHFIGNIMNEMLNETLLWITEDVSLETKAEQGKLNQKIVRQSVETTNLDSLLFEARRLVFLHPFFLFKFCHSKLFFDFPLSLSNVWYQIVNFKKPFFSIPIGLSDRVTFILFIVLLLLEDGLNLY